MKQTLKKLSVFMMAMAFVTLSGVEASAQAPQKFNYQGIARDAKGNPMAQQKMSLKISVLPTSDATTPEYEEIQTVNTNEFGLYTLQIGAGEAVTGEMKTVKWETGNKYIKVAIDAKGGTDFVDAGTSQLLSVPYAIYADKAGMAKTAGGGDRTGAVSSAAGHAAGDANYLSKFTGLNTIAKSQLFDNGTYVGIGTTTPVAKIHVNDLGTGATEIRVQHPNTSGASRLSFMNDASTGFGATSNYGILNKYGSGVGGSVAPGYPLSKLFGFNNSQGNLLVSSGGNVGLGNFIQATSTVLVRLHVDSATGNVGINTVTPTAKLDVNGQIRMQGGSPGAGKVMTSDATGIASWTTPSITSVGGTVNYIPKYTPNGTTLGNSKLQDLAFGYTGPELKFNSGSSQGRIINYAPKGGYGGFVATDSASMFNGYSDSVSYLLHTPSNTTIIGQDNGTLTIGKNGKLRTTGSFNQNTGNAQLSVESPFDTAGHFTSSSTNLLNGGILRAEYTGPFGTLNNDNKAIYGKSKVKNNYGYGIYGEGGFYGVYGITDSFGYAAIGGYGAGYATGISAASDAGTAVSAYSSSGTAIAANTYGQNSYGVTAYSGGTNGQGVYGYGDSIGTHGSARFYGAYNEANNTAGSGYSYGTNTKATSTVGRSYGINASAVGGNSLWNSYGIYAEATGSASTLWAGWFNGSIYATTGTFGTKPFTIDHPLDPANKVLRHSSIESPDMMNIYNGNITTDANGYATVEMPDYFDALNENFKYQLTVIGTFAQAIIKEEMANNKFVIQTNTPNVKVSWQVSGVRHDAVAKKFPVIVEEAKIGENKGHYFEPEAYGVSKTLRIGYQEPTMNDKVDTQALKMKKDFENKQRIEAEHKANNEKAEKNWKQQEAPKSNGNATGTATPRK